MLKHFGIYNTTDEIVDAIQKGLLEEPWIVMTKSESKVFYSVNDDLEIGPSEQVEEVIDLGSAKFINLVVNDLATIFTGNIIPDQPIVA